MIVREHDMREGQAGAGFVQDRAAVVGQAVAERYASQRQADAAADVEAPAAGTAANGQVVRAETFDVQVLGDGQLAARERDRLAIEAGIKDDAITTAGGGDLRPQRSWPAVVIVQHGQGTEDGAIFESFKARHERRPRTDWPPAP